MKSLITFLVCLIACASIQAQQTVGIGDIELRVKTAEGMVLHGLTPINGRVIGFVNGAPGLITVSSGPINLASGVTGTLPVANGGTGATTLAGANIAVTNAGNTFTGAQMISRTATTGAPTPYLVVTTPADTDLTASTENIGVSFTAATRQFATGALTLQRERVFAAPTYSAVAASTITTAVNADFEDPVAGTNATITNGYALRAGKSAFVGTIEFPTDNTYDIGGGLGSKRPANIYASNAVIGLGSLQTDGVFGNRTTARFRSTVDGIMSLVNNGYTDGVIQFNFGNYSSASFPAIKRAASSTVLQFRLSDDSAASDISARAVTHVGVTVANLPGSPTAGTVAYVTDGSATPAWGDTVTGGGSTKILVWYNGTNWTAIGK